MYVDVVYIKGTKTMFVKFHILIYWGVQDMERNMQNSSLISCGCMLLCISVVNMVVMG